MAREKAEKRHLVQISSEQVKKLIEIDKIRMDMVNYPISKKVHILLQEKLAEIFQSKSWFPHGDGVLKGKWFEYIREIFPTHIIAPVAIGVARDSERMIGQGFTKILVATESDKSWWCNYKEDIYNVAKYLLTNLKNRKFSEDYYKKYKNFFIVVRQLCHEIKNTDLSQYSKEELIEKYNYTYENLKRYHALSFDIDAIDIVLEEKMKQKFTELMRAKYKNNLNESDFNSKLNTKYSLLTTPTELSYLNKEQLELYKLAKEISEDKNLSKLFTYDVEIIYDKIKRDYPQIKKEIDALVKEYWWITLGWTVTIEKGFLHFLFDLKKILKENPNVENEINRLENFLRKTREEKKAMEKELNFDGEMLFYLDVFEHYVLFHDWRKEIQMKGTAAMNHFLFEVSRRYGYKYDDLIWCWPWEIMDIINTGNINANADKLNLEEIRKRKETFFMLVTREGIEQHTGEMAIKRRKEELAADVNNILDFRGIIASIGKASGAAKLCFSAKQAVEKIQKDDILVTSMTMPDYLPAMKKASAIVTDEGGVTCHAAIISRELKIPCIVGTKIATRVINDNDIIEVNANHGVVKIVKRSK